MSRPKVDMVDRIVDAWEAATPEQWKEAIRTICRIQADRESREAEPPKRGRPVAKKSAVEPKPDEASNA